MHVRPLARGFGAEVTGAGPAGPELGSALLGLLAEHQLLVLPGQMLAADRLVALNGALGAPEPQRPRQFLHPQHEEIFVISNIVEDDRPIGSTMNGFGWHTDMIYMPQPTALTMLSVRETPRAGGETLFASTRRLYESLEETERRRLLGARCVHSIETMYARRRGSPAVPPADRVASVRHPLVRRHPTGCYDALFLSRNSLAAVEADDPSVDVALVEALIARATQPHLVYAHASQPGDLLIWDNRGLLHSATDYDFAGDRRLVWRLVTGGEVPLAAEVRR